MIYTYFDTFDIDCSQTTCNNEENFICTGQDFAQGQQFCSFDNIDDIDIIQRCEKNFIDGCEEVNFDNTCITCNEKYDLSNQ